MTLPPWMILISARMKRRRLRKVWKQRWHRMRSRLSLRICLFSQSLRKGIMNPLPRIQIRKPLRSPSSVFKSCQLRSALLNGSKLIKRKGKMSFSWSFPCWVESSALFLLLCFSCFFLLSSSLSSFLLGAEVDSLSFPAACVLASLGCNFLLYYTSS